MVKIPSEKFTDLEPDPDDLQNLMVISLSKDTYQVKIFIKN